MTTFSIIVGDEKCVNNCPLCISRMTGYEEVSLEINWEKFQRAAQIAIRNRCNNVLLTGKGEPTLYPELIEEYLSYIDESKYERIELQTEGSYMCKGYEADPDSFMNQMDTWKKLGLNLIAISRYDLDPERNAEVFQGRIYPIEEFIEILREWFEIRISVCLIKGYVDSIEDIDTFVTWAKANDIMQLTFRKMDIPSRLDTPEQLEQAAWIMNHQLGPDILQEIEEYLDEMGHLCDILPHGAKVYEYRKQNVSLTTGLSRDYREEKARNLIWFPSGILTTSWEYIYGGRII